ncbi:heparinase II/III domain-containing protein [Pedobacter helvus]|uniref:Heparinase II/III family protein n=1 Tax=Pedobacter helvus TaxID=2563444 RepID=A0ABW9JHW5_9SPHI|nr:heparinase II/III family protein [Pedobacter ureilyticus]
MRILTLIVAVFTTILTFAQQQIDVAKVKEHPRLLLLANEESRIKSEIKNDKAWADVNYAVIQECTAIIQLPTIERKMIGRRLLQTSREALRRVFFLSYAWRMTGREEYFKKCEEELLAVSKFEDWNPDHFLDVAEMTLAVAIGYDWLYPRLSQSSKDIISKAIIDKGLTPALNPKHNGWQRGKNNWNQVCNTGITFGALAVFEQQPAVATQIIEKAIQSIKLPMAAYGPEGNYVEGYSYWAYGTSFNLFFISALEKIFGTDFGLAKEPGFLQTASFYQNLIGTSGTPFNYGDAGGNEGLQPAMFWFADKLKDNSLLSIEKEYLQTSKYNVKTNRLLPAAMIWGKGVKLDEMIAPRTNLWFGRSENEIAILRSGWEKGKDIYVGFKGGTASVGHAHMDAGSFVLDMDGVRWASELGMQQYNSLESAGLSIWDMSQKSQRWQVFRLNNYSHNTLTVNGKLHNMTGNAKLVSKSNEVNNTSAVFDLSSVFQPDLRQAQRGIAIIDKTYVTVRDEISTGNKEAVVRWAMLTPAKVENLKAKEATLTSKGKQLKFYVEGLEEVKLQTWSTDPPQSYDAPNPGTTLLGFELKLPANTKKSFNVVFVNANGKIVDKAKLKSLSNW